MDTEHNKIYKHRKNVMLYEKVLKTIEQKSLISEGQTVIAAVSGGADSVCLLDVLVHLSEKCKFSVECAHLNHNLRGSESDGDEEYVKTLCKGYGIKLHVKSADIKALAQGQSIEDTARRVRYSFFTELCKDRNAVVATAHHSGDNTETFFINLIRGSGSRGLCGIPSKREGIIRPLLDVSRQEILCHLEEKGISYRTDSTNADTDFLRNFIRHEIIPVFEKREGINIHKSVKRACENLNIENIALESEARRLYTDDTDVLCSLQDAVLYRILTAMTEESFGFILDSTHFEAVKKLLNKGQGKELIKDGVYAVCRNGKIVFRRQETKDTGIYPLEICENKVCGRVILIKKEKEIYKHLTQNCADYDKIVGNLFLRTRKEGDIFRHPYRNGTKKLSKLLKNDGTDRDIRDRLFVICDSTEKIIFVEGYGVNADVLATKESQNIISIEII